MTVKELYTLCNKLIKYGHGDRHIYISSDDEGNDRHELLCGFMDVSAGCVDDCRLQDMDENHGGEKNCILLG